MRRLASDLGALDESSAAAESYRLG